MEAGLSRAFSLSLSMAEERSEILACSVTCSQGLKRRGGLKDRAQTLAVESENLRNAGRSVRSVIVTSRKCVGSV